MKQQNYKERENEKKRGKRRYLERLVETEDAEREIKEYCPDEQHDVPLNDFEGKNYN